MVGAGEEPCAVFMTGARSPDKTIEYLVDPVAAKHGVSVAEPRPTPPARPTRTSTDTRTSARAAPWPPA